MSHSFLGIQNTWGNISSIERAVGLKLQGMIYLTVLLLFLLMQKFSSNEKQNSSSTPVVSAVIYTQGYVICHRQKEKILGELLGKRLQHLLEEPARAPSEPPRTRCSGCL